MDDCQIGTEYRGPCKHHLCQTKTFCTDYYVYRERRPTGKDD